MKTPNSWLIILGASTLLTLSLKADDGTNPGSTSLTSPDNTAQNKGDGNTNSITPLSQSNATEDIQVTRKIRQALVKDQDLSVNAKNIKIITTKDQVVYLRGVVETQEECDRITKLAKPFLGDRHLKNELKVRS